MGQQRRNWRLRHLVGILKDKASLSKAALLISNPDASSLHLAIIRATTHEPSSPPDEKHVSAVLSYGYSSRVTASVCIEALMDRLQSTHDAFVALKCLITVHNIIRRGSFILQDQLCVYPKNGGKNYLNLSNFRDESSPESWELSFWVRWYARFLESLLYTSRVLGVFICSASSSIGSGGDKEGERISGLLNRDLLREIDALVGVMEEVSWAPDSSSLGERKLAYEAMGLVGGDYCSAQKEIWARVNELKERLVHLSLADTIELSCALKRIENCRERLLSMFLNKKGSVGDLMWELIGEMKRKVDQREFYRDGQLIVRLENRGVKGTESARFRDERVMKTGGESRDSRLLLSSSFRMESVNNNTVLALPAI